MDGHSDQRDQGDGDDRMHDEHEPMPGRRVRSLGLAFDQNTVFVLFADDSWHVFLMVLMASAGLKVWRSPECKKPTPEDWLSARSATKFSGSPTWARTRDLRINSRTHSLPDGAKV